MNLKYFLVAFLISLLFWWGINPVRKGLEDFFVWRETKDSQILTAKINQKIFEVKLESLKPIRNWRIEDLKIEAKSAISVEVDNKGNQKVLFRKNSDKILAIASLTKLMTAKVVLDSNPPATFPPSAGPYYDLSQIIEISKEAVEQEGEAGDFKIGEKFRVKDFLYSLLMESSNDAAQALAEVIGEKTFVELMNSEAKNLNLESTHFANPTGLDHPKNYSTTEDLVKLANYLSKKPLIWEILSTPEFDLYSPEGIYHHRLLNKNELLGEIPGIVGGKTGWTPQAGDCLLLVLKSPKNQGYLINVILGSKDKFEEMRKLVEWIHKAYLW